MLLSPVLGWAGNRLRSVRAVNVACCLFYVAGSILYSVLSLFLESARYPMLLVSRFLVGVASANVAPLRSYVALATYESERTFHMAISTGAQAFGFVAGPIIQVRSVLHDGLATRTHCSPFQTMLTPIECSKKAFDPSLDRYIALDMYTAAG